MSRSPSRATPPPQHEPPEGRLRVLVVDDEAHIRRALERALRREHDVTALAGGREALAHLVDHRDYDVILCDLMMPVMTGLEFFEALADTAPELRERVVFLSGGVSSGAEQRTIEALEVEMIAKPFDLDFLRHRVAERAAQRRGG